MKKGIKILVVSTILSLNFLSVKNHNIYAENIESNIDLLIKNQESQKQLQDLLAKVENEIESKSVEEDSSVDTAIEVVSISFVDTKGMSSYNTSEIDSLENEKHALEKKLQETVIEGARLEKIIEQEEENYLKENDLDFTPAIWPVPSYTEISSAYGQRVHPISGELSFHRGIDIPAPQDTDILAADDGVVIFSGVQNGYGNVVKIKHFDGKETVYAHNNSNIVNKDDVVKKGQPIAKVGTTGNSTGNHVHFETIINGENENPIEVLSSK